MMPLIHPLNIQEAEETEYRKEQIAFAKMQVDFHESRARDLQAAVLSRWVLRVFRRRSHPAPHRA